MEEDFRRDERDHLYISKVERLDHGVVGRPEAYPGRPRTEWLSLRVLHDPTAVPFRLRGPQYRLLDLSPGFDDLPGVPSPEGPAEGPEPRG